MRVAGARRKKRFCNGIQLIGLAVALTAARSLCGEQASELVESSRALYRGNYERSRALAESYLKAHPDAPAAHILLARAEMAEGRFLPAYRELRQVLNLDPSNLDALYYLWRVSGILSQVEYQELYAMAPESARVHQLLAESLQAQGKTVEAEEEFRAALRANPQSVEVLDALGDLKRSQYRFDEAIEYYSRATKDAPRDYASAYGLGAAYLYLQDTPRAINFFRESLVIDPDSAPAHLALGDAMLRAGRAADAVEELKAAVRLLPEMRQAYTLLARAYQKLGRANEAGVALKKSQELQAEEIKSREKSLALEDQFPVSPNPFRPPVQVPEAKP